MRNLIVRIALSVAHGPRPAGHYLVDDVEARTLVAEGAIILPPLEAVVPQQGIDDDDVHAATSLLAAELFPAVADDVVTTPSTTTELPELSAEYVENLKKLTATTPATDEVQTP